MIGRNFVSQCNWRYLFLRPQSQNWQSLWQLSITVNLANETYISVTVQAYKDLNLSSAVRLDRDNQWLEKILDLQLTFNYKFYRIVDFGIRDSA